MPNDRRAIGRNPCHERNLFKNPFREKSREKISEKRNFVLSFLELIIFMNAKNEYRPPLPIQQAYKIQANPEQNNNFPIECQIKTSRNGSDLSNLKKLLCQK
jgi:hypothetical protein